MQKFCLFPVLFYFVFCFSSNFAATWTVQVMDFQFSPANLNVVVGDTIKWQWVNGSHTTTSLTIPNGAAPWDHALNLTSPTFSYRVSVAGNYHYKCTPHEAFSMVADFNAMPNAITPLGGSVPQLYNLSQNYPNPFNPVTYIKIDVPRTSFVKIAIYNLLGSEIEVLASQNLNAGSYSIDWDASKYSSGVYIYKMETADFSDTKKMILIK